jgi:hypothetical protein
MRKKMKKGVGLDVGTMNIVSARMGEKNPMTMRVRDAFLDVPMEAKKRLNLAKVPYAEMGDSLLILGDHALDYANLFGKEARRPLSGGLISASETDALSVLALMIKRVLGEPSEPGEHCYFSVPAAPVDDPSKDTVYHRGVFERIVRECGYTPHASNEAMAVIFAETAKSDFSGLAISFGSGMSNIALALNAMEGLCFSVARGGDWIDSGAASSIGSTRSHMCQVKEAGVDIMNPQGREQEAISFYYRSHIDYTIEKIAQEFRRTYKSTIPNPIPFVISGGTSRAVGFMDLFKERFESVRAKFPVPISEIRQASDPMNAVALGMLLQAMQEYE